MHKMIRSKPNFAPDGMAHGSAAPLARCAGALFDVAAVLQGGFAAQLVSASRGGEREEPHFHNQDGFDDGLVHSHGWARDR